MQTAKDSQAGRQRNESFEAGCEIERREDGIYVKHRDLPEWAGPYDSGFQALRAYRAVFFVE